MNYPKIIKLTDLNGTIHRVNTHFINFYHRNNREDATSVGTLDVLSDEYRGGERLIIYVRETPADIDKMLGIDTGPSYIGLPIPDGWIEHLKAHNEKDAGETRP